MEVQKLDYKRLISLVKERRELYDNSFPDYRNRECISSIWTNIANELGATVMDVKAKWQMLRCNYMREKKKVKHRIMNGATATYSTTWPYFYMLSFLDAYKDESFKDEYSNVGSFYDQQVNKIIVKSEILDDEGSFGTTSIPNNNLIEEQECNKNKSNACSDSVTDLETHYSAEENSMNKMQNMDCRLTERIKIEVDIRPSQKRKLSTEEGGGVKASQQIASPEPSDHHKSVCTSYDDGSLDSDQLFLNSLLPFIKALSPTKNLEFRCAVLKLLLDISNK